MSKSKLPRDKGTLSGSRHEFSITRTNLDKTQSPNGTADEPRFAEWRGGRVELSIFDVNFENKFNEWDKKTRAERHLAELRDLASRMVKVDGEMINKGIMISGRTWFGSPGRTTRNRNGEPSARLLTFAMKTRSSLHNPLSDSSQDLRSWCDLHPLATVDEKGGLITIFGNHPVLLLPTTPPFGYGE